MCTRTRPHDVIGFVKVHLPVTFILPAYWFANRVCANQKCPPKPPPIWWKSIFEVYLAEASEAKRSENVPALVHGCPQFGRTDPTLSATSSTTSDPAGSPSSVQLGG